LKLVGLKVMVLEEQKKNLVKFLLMMNVLIWFKIKDLLLMVLLSLLVVLVNVMLNLIKMALVIIPLGKTSCLIVVNGCKLLLNLRVFYGL